MEELIFKDISSEFSRTYVFPDGSEVYLCAPHSLNVSKSGGHRVITSDGTSHYIPHGWIHLYFKTKSGEPAFSF